MLLSLLLAGAAALLTALPSRRTAPDGVGPPFVRRFYWLLAWLPYWCFVFYLLWNVVGVGDDGYGPGPGLYWGHPRYPTEREYNANRTHFLLRYSIPYLACAAIMAWLGCSITAVLVRRFKAFSSRPFVASSTLAMVLFLLAAGISDVGGALNLWFAPRFLYPERIPIYTVLALTVPPALFTGVLALARKRLGT